MGAAARLVDDAGPSSMRAGAGSRPAAVATTSIGSCPGAGRWCGWRRPIATRRPRRRRRGGNGGIAEARRYGQAPLPRTLRRSAEARREPAIAAHRRTDRRRGARPGRAAASAWSRSPGGPASRPGGRPRAPARRRSTAAPGWRREIGRPVVVDRPRRERLRRSACASADQARTAGRPARRLAADADSRACRRITRSIESLDVGSTGRGRAESVPSRRRPRASAASDRLGRRFRTGGRNRRRARLYCPSPVATVSIPPRATGRRRGSDPRSACAVLARRPGLVRELASRRRPRPRSRAGRRSRTATTR